MYSIRNESMIFISESFKSYISLVDFAQPEFTLCFSLTTLVLGHEELLFNVTSGNYLISLIKTENGSLILKRNSKEVCADLCLYNLDIASLWVTVAPNQIGITISSSGNIELSNRISTDTVYPPQELIRYIRNASIEPRIHYNNQESFREKVQSNILWLSNKISTTGGYKSYWNITYDGQKIIDRKPKKETEVQPLIHQAIYDVMESSSITVTPEFPTGDGNVDFLFSAYIEDQGMVTICAEVKLAHSKDLINGYTHQLPKYMSSTNSKYGIYVVLNYKGDWFDKPVFGNGFDAYDQLMMATTKVNFVEPDRIRVVEVNLAKPLTASKFKP